MALDERQLEREYAKWVKSLPKEEKAKVKEAGLDKPLNEPDGSHKRTAGASGYSISRGSQTTAPDAKLLAIVARDLNELEPVCGHTPLDSIIEGEEDTSNKSADGFTAAEIARIRADAVSALLGYLFSPFNQQIPSPVDVSSKVFLLAYTLRPELIAGWSLERIAKLYDSNRQCFSKRLIKQDAQLNCHAKSRKGTAAVSLYREGTRAWWAEKRAAEHKAKRKDYLAKWRAAHAAEVKAYQAIYRAKYRERLNAAKRKKRQQMN